MGATNSSKLYTPFTLFCIFFSIYFNADLLGQVFLSGKWQIQEPALKAIANRSLLDWFCFVCEVVAYSLGMILIYGLTQAIAAFLWGLSDWANTSLSAVSNKSKYVAKTDFEKVVSDSNELRRKERELYTRIASYHTWKPEDIDKLNDDIKQSQASFDSLLEEKEASIAENSELKETLKISKKEADKLIESRDLYLRNSKYADKESAFFHAYVQVLASIKTSKVNIDEAENGEKSLKLFKKLVKEFNIRGAINEVAIYCSSTGSLLKPGSSHFSLPHGSTWASDQLSSSIGATMAIIESFGIAHVEIISVKSPENPQTHSFTNVKYKPLMRANELLKIYLEEKVEAKQ